MALCSRKSRSGWPSRTLEGLALSNRPRQRLTAGPTASAATPSAGKRSACPPTHGFPPKAFHTFANNELRADKNLLKSPTFSRNVHEHFTWPNDSRFGRATVDGMRRNWAGVCPLLDRNREPLLGWQRKDASDFGRSPGRRKSLFKPAGHHHQRDRRDHLRAAFHF